MPNSFPNHYSMHQFQRIESADYEIQRILIQTALQNKTTHSSWTLLAWRYLRLYWIASSIHYHQNDTPTDFRSLLRRASIRCRSTFLSSSLRFISNPTKYLPLIMIMSSGVNALPQTKHTLEGISLRAFSAITQPQDRRKQNLCLIEIMQQQLSLSADRLVCNRANVLPSKNVLLPIVLRVSRVLRDVSRVHREMQIRHVLQLANVGKLGGKILVQNSLNDRLFVE